MRGNLKPGSEVPILKRMVWSLESSENQNQLSKEGQQVDFRKHKLLGNRAKGKLDGYSGPLYFNLMLVGLVLDRIGF